MASDLHGWALTQSPSLLTPNFKSPISFPSLFTCLTLSSILIPSHSFPKTMNQYFCTIKFNHNYKNVALGLQY